MRTTNRGKEKTSLGPGAEGAVGENNKSGVAPRSSQMSKRMVAAVTGKCRPGKALEKSVLLEAVG